MMRAGWLHHVTPEGCKAHALVFLSHGQLASTSLREPVAHITAADVHITSDDVIVMFHDPSLERTTNGSGLIRDQPYHGNIENIRTTKTPVQKIPTFHELCDFLMRPECMHVKVNIDIKPDNDPDRLFCLMREIVNRYSDCETALSPRIILGLWHPKFLHAALKHVPLLRRIHIGGSPSLARQYFWKHCDGFSMWFAGLVGAEGQAFLREAQGAGKDVYVWTVNRPDEMIEATRWGVKAVLTDKTEIFRDLRVAMAKDFAATRKDQVGLFFRWASWRYWMLPQFVIQTMWVANLEKRAGESFKAADDRALREAAAKVVTAAAAPHEDTSGATTVIGSPDALKPSPTDNAAVPPITASLASPAA
ncbi:PLC-like phosphodiesterase [Tilletiaria anomala UBC 951]|uniref:PLC-like phosphodiesterase n=1 Tax=Tilletiaria anomala (strain ATCC 24038 / CBS 436.72 / UBC 951) TaxID=1037660 RepID=A0A066VYJ8_TILAU|nr:PLC-like phosphodiesterase [Tilletiaria anomala UBC 951]KDN46807.1 PLC-like phosphodiesterase [Tilletiaria anomala UBC 951]